MFETNFFPFSKKIVNNNKIKFEFENMIFVNII